MSEKNINLAKNYYTALGKKDVAGMEKYLHPDVQWVSPLGEMAGKEAVLNAAKEFVHFFHELNIRAQFGDQSQVMLAFDFECPQPVGTYRSAVLLNFSNELITKIEIFSDGRPFEG